MRERRLTGLAGIASAALLALSAVPGGASSRRGLERGIRRLPERCAGAAAGPRRRGRLGLRPDDAAGRGARRPLRPGPSCGDCPSEGGGQFYTGFRSTGRDDLADAPVLHLSHQVRSPPTGTSGAAGSCRGCTAARPGRPAAASTVRRGRPGACGGSATASRRPRCSTGDRRPVAHRAAGGGPHHRHHHRLVRRPAGAAGAGHQDVADIPFAGVFFPTFFGGHDTSWGPSRDVHARFRDFRVTT